MDRSPIRSRSRSRSPIRNNSSQLHNITLTGIVDADTLILQELDGKDLSKVCISNKYVNEICNNDEFWENKLKKEDIPFFKNGRSLNEWVKFYTVASKAKLDAKISLIMFDMLHDKDEYYKFIEIRDLNSFHEDLDDLFMLNSILQYILPEIGIITGITRLLLRKNNDGLFNVGVWNYYGEALFEQVLTPKQTTDLLTLVYEYAVQDKIRLLTVDYDENIPLIVTQDYLRDLNDVKPGSTHYRELSRQNENILHRIDLYARLKELYS